MAARRPIPFLSYQPNAQITSVQISVQSGKSASRIFTSVKLGSVTLC
jgi:hypothetical protein